MMNLDAEPILDPDLHVLSDPHQLRCLVHALSIGIVQAVSFPTQERWEALMAQAAMAHDLVCEYLAPNAPTESAPTEAAPEENNPWQLFSEE